MKKFNYIVFFFVVIAMTSCKKEVFLPIHQNDTTSTENFHTRSASSSEIGGDTESEDSGNQSIINSGSSDPEFNDGQEIVDPKDPSSKPNPNRPRGTKAY